MSRPGEASSACTKFQVSVTFHGRRITRGWVVTRRNSYRIDQVVYQASARPCQRSNQPRQPAWNGESASAAYTKDVGIDNQHYRPSMAWYKASRSVTSTNVPPLWNVGRGGTSCRFAETGTARA